MHTYRTTARVVGALFIVATVTAIVGGSLLLPLTEPSDVEEIGSMQAQLVTGALLEQVLVLSVLGIAVLLFPVLRRSHEGLALGYVGTRTLEAVLLLAASISALVLLTVSEEIEGPAAQPVADLALAAREWTYLIGSMVGLGVSALVLYSLLYRAGLVPAWLSLWGLAGGALILLRGLLETYGVELSALAQGLMAAPIALNEMVLAVWLMVKGFSPAALGAESAEQPAAGPRLSPPQPTPPGG